MADEVFPSPEARAHGKRIAKAREKAGLTQEQLAKKVGCGTATIQRIERGSGEGSRYLLAVHRFLGLPADDPYVGAQPLGGDLSIQGMQHTFAPVQHESIRADMVSMALRRGDPIEVIRALDAAEPPPDARFAWWAALYRDLVEQHVHAHPPRDPAPPSPPKPGRSRRTLSRTRQS